MLQVSKNSIFCLFVTRKLFGYHEHLKTQFFAYLLALPAGRPCLRLRIRLALTVGLAVNGAELMGKEVAVGFSR